MEHVDSFKLMEKHFAEKPLFAHFPLPSQNSSECEFCQQAVL